MKPSYLLLGGAALLLAACNQTAPVAEQPTTAPASTTTTNVPAPPPNLDSAAAPADKVATAPAPVAPALREAETLKATFRFKPAPNADDPSHPKTNARLLLQGAKPLEIDLGNFAGKPDVVDANKAKQAGFPSGMLMGFRSYHAASGTSSDLAVLNVDGRRLRIVQRRVEETAAEPGTFETSREIPLPANTAVVAAPLK
ncbi:hypothetical protein I2I05_05900 [Hymenobacter sp. BT683]|uniref:Lipoprotein n=1 Tax=Hymenobacter jeongseonensis TaxID=2791027 RepID=A0ABS0IF00_9BACT|nr:hypothetical protein [Hymenobacter jeongseonensis]MBF9236923.1 hypothetical protein [Hymenobacter jeongseonensis]